MTDMGLGCLVATVTGSWSDWHWVQICLQDWTWDFAGYCPISWLLTPLTSVFQEHFFHISFSHKSSKNQPQTQEHQLLMEKFLDGNVSLGIKERDYSFFLAQPQGWMAMAEGTRGRPRQLKSYHRWAAHVLVSPMHILGSHLLSCKQFNFIFASECKLFLFRKFCCC